MSEWNKWVDEYVRVCALRGLAPTTIELRRREMERWGLWLRRRNPKVSIREINQEVIVDYVKNRTSFSSRSTVAGVMSEMRCLGEFLVSQGVWAQNPLRWMRGPKMDPRRKLPQNIKPEHIKGLLTAAAGISNLYHRQLVVTALLLLYGTGIRRGELIRLDLGSWDSTRGTLRIDNSKSNLVREIPVPEVVAAALEAYLPHRTNLLARRGRTDQPALFVNNRGDRMQCHPISMSLKRLTQKAKLPRITLHQLRHSCATELLESGVSVAEVQRVLGHACLATTFRYTHVADPSRRLAMMKHPINAILGASQLEPLNQEA